MFLHIGCLIIGFLSGMATAIVVILFWGSSNKEEHSENMW